MRFVKNEPETIQALCYQYAGETSDGRPLAAPGSEKNLKCFMVDELSEVRFADDGIWETVTEVGKLYSMERWKVRFSDVYDCLENHVETDEDET